VLGVARECGSRCAFSTFYRIVIDQRRVDVCTAGFSKVSCNEMCVSVGRSVGLSTCFYLGVQRFCSETLSSSAFRPTPPVYKYISSIAKMFMWQFVSSRECVAP